jgi:hypothetical protein
MPPEFIREQIRKTRALTSRPFGVNFVPPCAPPPGAEGQLAVCLEERVALLSLFWCDVAPFVERSHAAGIVVMLAVGSAQEALRAAASGVDIIVAQGAEAGGHVRDEVLVSSPARNAKRISTTRNGWSRHARQTQSVAKPFISAGLPTHRVGFSETPSPTASRLHPARSPACDKRSRTLRCSCSQSSLPRSTQRVRPSSWPIMLVGAWASFTISSPRRRSWSK